MFIIQFWTKKLVSPYVRSGATELHCHFWNVKMYKNGKVNSFKGSTRPKILIISKTLQIKVVQDSISYKKVNGCICVSPTGVEWREHQSLASLKYYNVLKLVIFGAPSSTPGGDRHMRSVNFCMKLNSEQLLFEDSFDIMQIFSIFRHFIAVSVELILQFLHLVFKLSKSSSIFPRSLYNFH